MMSKKKHTPPGLASWILRQLSFYENLFSFSQDIEEEYYDKIEENNKISAYIWFWFHTFKSTAYYLEFSSQKGITMFKNYMKIAFRNLKLHKGFSFINISGFAIGLTCCLLILLYVKDELSYDRFHEDSHRIYRLGAEYWREGRWEPYASNAWITGDLFKNAYAEVEELVRIRGRSDIVRYKNVRSEESAIAEVETSFFKLFSFKLLEGNPENVLNEPYSVVVSEEIAEKYFGSENAIGKTLEFNDGEFNLNVSGVMKNMPQNSHFQANILISGATSRQINNQNMFTSKGWDSQFIYFRLPEGYDYTIIEKILPQFVSDHMGPYITPKIFQLTIQPLEDIYLKVNVGNEIGTNSSISYVYIFSTIAFVTLLIACINYMNLSTARSSSRAKDVGMRKVVGAQRHQIFKQFISESVLVSVISMVIALALVYLLLPAFNQFTGKSLSVFQLTGSLYISMFLVSLIIISIASGSYPAFFLSSFQPVNIIKGVLSKGTSGTSMRRTLVVFQFGISSILIISSFIIYSQLSYLRDKDLGINKERLISVPMQTLNRSQIDVVKDELEKIPQVVSVGASHIQMPGWLSNSALFKAEGIEVDPNSRLSMKIVNVDFDFFKTIDAQILLGRDFSREFPSDPDLGIILNETAVKQLGWENPLDKMFQVGFPDENNPKSPKSRVIGIVKDFHFESLHRRIAPIIFDLRPTRLNYFYIKINEQDITGTVGKIRSVYEQFVTDRDYVYTFIDERIHQFYNGEEKFLEVFSIFTSLAIFIACLGIFGLASFTAEKRTKEFGIRKVLGASSNSIIMLLIREFVLLVLISNLLAWPVAYYFMNNWLTEFTYKTAINPVVFILTMFLAMIIAILTVMYQGLKASTANPADSLRYE